MIFWQTILKEHEKWLADPAEGEQAVFYRENFRKFSFKNLDLRHVVFKECDLDGSDFSNSDLRHAVFSGSNLSFTNFTFADLRFTDLRNVVLESANLRCAEIDNANLKGADFYHADLRGVNFNFVELKQVEGLCSIFQSPLTILKFQTGTLKAYKILFEDYTTPFEGFKYEMGKVYETDDYDEDEREDCGKGFNVATLEWCLRHTYPHLDDVMNLYKRNLYVYIEVEFDPKDIVAIPYGSDGKFRVRKMKITRELSNEELVNYLTHFGINSKCKRRLFYG